MDSKSTFQRNSNWKAQVGTTQKTVGVVDGVSQHQPKNNVFSPRAIVPTWQEPASVSNRPIAIISYDDYPIGRSLRKWGRK